jgi:hypothetical protein
VRARGVVTTAAAIDLYAPLAHRLTLWRAAVQAETLGTGELLHASCLCLDGFFITSRRLRLLMYRTKINPDDDLSCTPVAIVDGKVAGWGRNYYDNVLNADITVRQARRTISDAHNAGRGV